MESEKGVRYETEDEKVLMVLRSFYNSGNMVCSPYMEKEIEELVSDESFRLHICLSSL